MKTGIADLIPVRDDIINETFHNKSKKVLPSNQDLVKIVRNFENYLTRSEYIRRSHCLLTHEFLSEITSYLYGKRIIEVAAGGGWLSEWIERYGVNIIITTDNLSWEKHLDVLPRVVKKDAAQTVLEHPSDIVVLSWPYMNDMAYSVWNAMRSGQELLFIGEGMGGCTANDNFFESLPSPTYFFECLLSWEGIHDYAAIYTKK